MPRTAPFVARAPESKARSMLERAIIFIFRLLHSVFALWQKGLYRLSNIELSLDRT
jgi:hypothetical protein